MSTAKTSNGLTSSAGGSPVRTSATPGSGKASTAPAADSGLRCADWFAKYDRDTSSWKTSTPCSAGGWDEYSETWPCAGMMRNGTVCRRPPLVHHISAKGFSSLPTPTVSAATQGVNQPDGKRGQTLLGAARGQKWAYWPTPLARDSRTHKGNVPPPGHQGGLNLGQAIGGTLNPTWVEWLMGFPIGWTDSEAWEMPLFHMLQSTSGG